MQCQVSYLVWTAPALLYQNPNHLVVVLTGSIVNGKRALIIRQHWVSPCLKKSLYRGEVTLLAGGKDQAFCKFASVPALLHRYFDLSETGSPSRSKLAMNDSAPLDNWATTTAGGATICNAMSSITFMTANCGRLN